MALLHDAPEYVIGDLISPFKAAVGIDYKAFEHRLLAAIHIRFGLPPKPPADLEVILKKADIISAFHEATQLAGFTTEEAKKIFGVPPRGTRFPRMIPLPTAEAQAQFLERFKRLTA
jgi:5'-deoxynucleotidase YfbR-like HD superfamily hydrolase